MSDFIHLLSTGDPQLSFLAFHNQKSKSVFSHALTIIKYIFKTSLIENFNPFEKYVRPIGSFPQGWGENNKYVSCHHLVHLFGRFFHPQRSQHWYPTWNLIPWNWGKFVPAAKAKHWKLPCFCMFFSRLKERGETSTKEARIGIPQLHKTQANPLNLMSFLANPCGPEMATVPSLWWNFFKLGTVVSANRNSSLRLGPSRKFIPSLTFLNGSSRTMFWFKTYEFITITSAKNN